VTECTDFKCVFCESLPFLEDDITGICYLLKPFSFTQVEVSAQKSDVDIEFFLGSQIDPDQFGIQIFADSEQAIEKHQQYLSSDFTVSARDIRDNSMPTIIYGANCDMYWANYIAWLADFPRETVFISDDLIGSMLAIYPINEERLARLNRDCLPITIRTDDQEAGAKLQAYLRALGFTVKANIFFSDSSNLHPHFCMRLACVTFGVPLPNNYDSFTEELMDSTQRFLLKQLHVPDDCPFMFESMRGSCLTGMVIELPFGSFKKGKIPAYKTLGAYDCLIVTDKPKSKALKRLRKRLFAAGMGSVEITAYDEKPMLREVVFAKDILGDETGMKTVLGLMSEAIDAQEIPELKVRESLSPLANIVVRMPMRKQNHLPDKQLETNHIIDSKQVGGA